MPNQPSVVDQVFRHWDPMWRMKPTDVLRQDVFRDTPFVDIQNVADYCNQGRGTAGMKYQRIGRCFSPWKSAFVFWHEPLRDFGTAYKLALVFQSDPTPETPEAIISGVFFQSESKGGPWTVISGMFCLMVPEGGLLEETDDGLQVFKMVMAGGSSVDHLAFTPIRPIVERITSTLHVKALDSVIKMPGTTWVKDTQCDIQILLSAFSFAHCKNVQVAEAGRTSPPPKWREQGVPSVKYRVVRIDTRATKRSGGEGQDTGRHMSLHIVRGHFKHYSKEKPLLGKHVGTYWWPDNTRGDLAVGEVKKAYQVEP